MWILQRLKEVLSATMDNLSLKTEGRWKFYVLFYLLISVIVFVLSIIVAFGFVELGVLPSTGSFLYEAVIYVFTDLSRGTFLLAAIIFFSYRSRKHIGGKHRYELSDLFSNGSSSAWGFFMIGFFFITILLGVFYSQNLYAYGANNSPINSLLDVFYYPNATERLFSAYASFVLDNLQLLIIVLFGVYVKTRKIDFKMLFKNWKQILLLFILVNTLDLVNGEFVGLVNSLFIGIIKIPFEELWIPSFLGLVVVIIIGGAYFMLLDNITLYTLRSSGEKDEDWTLTNDETDLLDQ